MSDLRTELLKIREKRGLLTAPIVVEEATDPEHPLHGRFTWDDHEAAQRWRITEAYQLLRVTFRVTMNDRHADLRAFHVLRATEEHPQSQYVPIEEIATDPVAEKIILNQMRRRWHDFRITYQDHEMFLDIIHEDWPEDWDFPQSPNNGTDG